MKTSPRLNIIIIHPDLGIGGAERLIIDVALALQNRGHQVTIYTSHCDKSHCFEEARDGTLDIRVRGNTIFPPLLLGRFHLLMAVLRQLHLTISVLSEMGRTGKTQTKAGEKREESEEYKDDIFIIDQLPACVPVLKTWGRRFAQIRGGKQRILFYCHFPDQLLARRNEGYIIVRLLKEAYRYPLDWFEGWAMSASDKVVANSNFTRGVVKRVFGSDRLGDVKIVYPCVDTKESAPTETEVVKGELWGEKKILLSINRFERKKGIDLAIRAYNGLSKEERIGTRLVIAGGYDNRVQENVQYHKELNDLALRLGLQTATSKTVISALSIPDAVDVLFLLSVPSAFRDTLLHNSKLLLYTPVNEHFGIVPVEAMHAGLPVLASNTGGPLESVVENETGWLRDTTQIEEWTSIMRNVLLDLTDQDLAKMAASGKKRVKDVFSLHALEDKLEEELRDMLESNRRPFMNLQYLLLAFLFSGVVGAVMVALILRRVWQILEERDIGYTSQDKMPEVIDLLDSSPLEPSHLQPPPSTQARHSSVRFPSPSNATTASAAAIPASSPNFLSDDFDSSLFTFDTPGRSAKKRKLTPQAERTASLQPRVEAQPRAVAKSSTQNVIHSDYSIFTFSDDIESPGLPHVNRANTGTPTAITKKTTVSTTSTTFSGLSTTKVKAYKRNGEESDPIVFTSSAPEHTTAKERQQSRQNKLLDDSGTKSWPSVITIDDDDYDEIQDWGDPFNVSPQNALDKLLGDPRPSLKPAYSDRTAALLASLRTQDSTEKKLTTTSKGKNSTTSFDDVDFDFGEDSLSDVPQRPTDIPKTKRKLKVDAEEKVAKAQEREAAREQRKREKEAEKERKRLEKEKKAKEKQLAADIAEVNKSKIHKKESIPEMIVDLASTFEGTSVGNQVVEYLKNLSAEHTFFESSMPNIVKWRRKKRSNYNEDAARWEPCQPYIASEDHVLCMLSAQEFVDMVICEGDMQTLDGHVQRLKGSYRDCKPIYLIEGLTTWMRRNQNSRNRAYQAEVLRQINDVDDTPEDTNAQGKQRGRKTKKAKKPEDTPPVADDTIEDALLELQVTHNCLIYHTNAPGETAEWIKNFSEHISTIPYRHVQMGNYDGAAFCMETGQVKTGEDKVDTFVKMLQEINRVTAPMAYGIVSQYPSAVDLLHAMKKHGPTLLENVRKSANKNGALTDSRIGLAVSKRLYKVFMGLDETSADI
ncbi:alpha-1,2-mannosyltransferase (Alg2), putative [Talaromyces stipitatus ATCC 10500]|uniref:Asparagine-linked glycosylation protein 2 n=1 Tax=Talaromyces stipitatus (strain ATCC 10500 / CBS 375.48 / QM 6759 / NRRL 1006) TaxID=441959 RepID=B8MRI9_TALSN|nr:alpha-1,2-mannosyltransferase (Alg2), putative [Talaromyces stipitatus ATCC 10500]EED13126.1 alpha-1,2-mannosyltransferase (Alg2), putative [Talaromyces stipitatus ATCC 10500]